MRLSERTPLVAVLLLSSAVAVGLAFWYIDVRQEVQTQQALEQTRDAFERLEQERSVARENAAESGQSAFQFPAPGVTAPPAVTPQRQIETTSAAARSPRTDAARRAGSGMLGGASTTAIYVILGVLLLTTLIALGIAASSYRLVLRERRRHGDDHLAHTVAPEPSPMFRSSPITIIDAEAVKDVTPEEIKPYAESEPQRKQEAPAQVQWTSVITQMPLAMLLAGTDGEIREVNEAFTELTGYAKKDLSSIESWLTKGRRVRPDELQSALNNLKKAFTMQATPPAEATVWTRTGEPRQWLLQHAVLNAGTPDVTWALFGTDITDRANAHYVVRTQLEEAQREAAELAGLYQAAPSGLAVFDTQFRFLRVNERMAEMDGIPIAEHAGKTVTKLLPHVATAVEPVLNRVLESGKAVSHVSVRVKTAAQPRSERHWLVSCHPLKDEHGRTVRIEWAVEDVTERQVAESSVRENEAALRAIVDNLPAPLCVKDLQGRYLYANHAYECFTQLGANPIKGKMDHEIFPWEAADSLRENDDEALGSAAPIQMRASAQFKDGVAHFDAAKMALRDKDNKPYAVCAMYTDLTDRIRAQSDLEASESRYRAIFDSSPQPILVDRDNRLVYVNAACARLLAAEQPQQLLGKSILEFIDVSGHKAFQERIQRALRRKNGEKPLQTRFTRLDGAELDVELDAALYETESERAVQILVRDITEQRKAEEALRHSEARFRRAVEENPALIRVADASGACVYWNRQWQRYTGIAPEKGFGLAWNTAIHAEDRDRVVHALANARHQRDPLRLEYRLRDRDNQYRWVHDIATPRLDDAGAYLGYVACVTDISERKRAEDLLRQSVERFKAVSERAPAMIWLDDARGCEYANDTFREFLGVRSGTTSPDWTERIHPDDRDRYVQMRRDADKRAAPWQAELRLQRADGEYRRMHCVATPRLASDGRFEGYIGSLTDITELRVTEQALREADQRRNAFLAALAEELKTPIAPIVAAAEALRTITGSDVRARRASDIIVRQSQHLVRVLEDAQDFSQLLEDRITLAPQRTELGALVYRAVEIARPLIEARRHDLGVQMEAGRAQLDADPARLTQAITGLLSYEAKCLPEGSRIALSAQESDEGIVLRIRDNGPGCAPEALGALFEVFGPRDADSPSGGIGLPLAHHLIELHGGSLDASSDGPGTGVEFIARLPGVPAAASHDEKAVAGEGRNEREDAVVVEDNGGGVRRSARARH